MAKVLRTAAVVVAVVATAVTLAPLLGPGAAAAASSVAGALGFGSAAALAATLGAASALLGMGANLLTKHAPGTIAGAPVAFRLAEAAPSPG